jgi:hypothetical protein
MQSNTIKIIGSVYIIALLKMRVNRGKTFLRKFKISRNYSPGEGTQFHRGLTIFGISV